MEKHFYIGDGPQAESLIAEALARENVAREARKALIAEYETDGLILSVWNDGKVTGLAFEKPASRPYLKGETRLSNGEGYGYYPKLSTKEGKRLAQKLEAEELTFSMSKFILDKLNLHRMVEPKFPNRECALLLRRGHCFRENPCFHSGQQRKRTWTGAVPGGSGMASGSERKRMACGPGEVT